MDYGTEYPAENDNLIGHAFMLIGLEQSVLEKAKLTGPGISMYCMMSAYLFYRDCENIDGMKMAYDIIIRGYGEERKREVNRALANMGRKELMDRFRREMLTAEPGRERDRAFEIVDRLMFGDREKQKSK